MLLSLRGKKDKMLVRRSELQEEYENADREDPEREKKKIAIRRID